MDDTSKREWGDSTGSGEDDNYGVDNVKKRRKESGEMSMRPPESHAPACNDDFVQSSASPHPGKLTHAATLSPGTRGGVPASVYARGGTSSEVPRLSINGHSINSP